MTRKKPVIPTGVQCAISVADHPYCLSKPADMKRVFLSVFVVFLVGMTSACSPINVMGRSLPDQEYIALYDAGIAREKSELKPNGVHDEYGRVPSWNEYWRTIGGTNPVPPTAQSRRLKRYIIEHRRAAGLPELSGTPN